MSIKLQCPVCGKEKSQISVSEYDCDNCGFNNAYVRYFASAGGHELWLDSVNRARAEWNKREEIHAAASVQLYAGDNLIALTDKNRRNITIISGSGSILHEQDAAGFSACERNYAVLYENGTVKVFGEDNSFGQKNTGSWKNIQSVLAAPNCTYGVTESGEVVYAGSLCSRAAAEWKNVRLLRAGNDSIVGLSRDGKVYMEKDFGVPGAADTVKGWSGITDIMASRDCVIGLSADGTVRFAGRQNDARAEAEAWRHITAIALDNSFAYGLSDDGKVHMAGTCKAFLDRGRSSASEWSNVASLSSNHAGIGAVDENGELLFAGTITGDLSRMKEAWNAEIRDGFRGETV